MGHASHTADVNEQIHNNFASTPLLSAVFYYRGNNIVKSLMAGKANLVLTNSYGLTVLHFLTRRCDYKEKDAKALIEMCMAEASPSEKAFLLSAKSTCVVSSLLIICAF